MNFDKEPKSRGKKFLEGVGGEGGAGMLSMNKKAPIFFYTGHIVTISSTELYSLMKIFLMVFKIEGMFYITIQYHDNIPHSIQVIEQTSKTI